MLLGVASHPSFFHVIENPLSNFYTTPTSLTSSHLMLLGFPLGAQFFLFVLNRGQSWLLPANVSQFPKQCDLYELTILVPR